MAKGQAAPFLVSSLAGTMALAAAQRDWRTARRLAAVLGGSWVGYRLLLLMKDVLLAGHTTPHPHVAGLTEAIALVFVPSIRLETIRLMLACWPEYTIALGYAAWHLWRPDPQDRNRPIRPIDQTVRTMLLLLAGSWLAWFALLCAGEPRYALPGLFIAAPFTAALLFDLTRGFDIPFVQETLWAVVRTRRFTSDGAKAAVAVLLLVVMGWVVVQERYAFRSREDDRDVLAVTAYLNSAMPAAAVIETYDSELFLFLNRPYTYAPPQTLVEIIRHGQYPDQPVTYDPLQAKPDYLVVGEFGRWAEFYKPLIEQNRVRLVKTIGRYQIYEPIRP
jgi:hypothetical protein